MRTIRTIIAAAILAALALPAYAGPGPEVIYGTAGADDLQGGHSPDVIYGLAGDDIIHGNRAPDVLYGGKGDDKLNGFGSGETHDTLVGGPGWDTCVGTSHDTFRGCEVVKIRRGLGPR